MKLLLITSIKAYEKEIKDILKSAQVSSYTYTDATGYRDASALAIQENWFSNDMDEGEAVLFYALVKKEFTDKVFDRVVDFNIIGGIGANFLIGNDVILSYANTREVIGETKGINRFVNHSSPFCLMSNDLLRTARTKGIPK